MGSYLSPEPLLQNPWWVRRELKAGHQVLPYGYARNNPVRYVDPSGRFPTLSQAAIEAWLLLQQGGAAVANGVRSGGAALAGAAGSLGWSIVLTPSSLGDGTPQYSWQPAPSPEPSPGAACMPTGPGSRRTCGDEADRAARGGASCWDLITQFCACIHPGHSGSVDPNIDQLCREQLRYARQERVLGQANGCIDREGNPTWRN